MARNSPVTEEHRHTARPSLPPVLNEELGDPLTDLYGLSLPN